MEPVKAKALLYFVKYPEPGKVKTRLAKTIGPEAAAKAYRGLAESIFKILLNGQVKSKSIETLVFFDPPEKSREIEKWLPGAATYRPQEGKDLGERLTRAFERAFDSGARQVMALGSDTLDFKDDLISKAFEALAFYDVVIGPAKDGGYYLIGVQEVHRNLFQDVPWSTPEVLKTTQEKIKEEELTHFLLPELDDLDEIKNIKLNEVVL